MLRVSGAAVLLLANSVALATTAYGDLNNFDSVNNTGHKCYGFEIELDDVKSTDITYTYDWNHYGAPVIREDNTQPGHPKTFVRYTAKTKDANGQWLEFTNAETTANPILPTNGHMCTDPSVNAGCEHFGIGYYGAPSAIKYNWLVDDGSGGGALTLGEAVNVATPTYVYSPPLPPDPVNNVPAQPAQVVAVIPAPVVPIAPAKRYGEAAWVKVIKTSSHNNKNVPLKDLIGVDNDGDGKLDWTNGEPDEVETEWKLLQTNNQNNGNKGLLDGQPDVLANGDETVTRRYEFYAYGGSPLSIDGETGEAMCDTVAADNTHGSGIVTVTDANGNDHPFDCSADTVVGDYVGAQMAGFDPAAPLGVIDNLQDGELNVQYINRTLVVGGDRPYNAVATGLPPGMTVDAASGVLSGTPTHSGSFNVHVQVTDAVGASASHDFTMRIVGEPNNVPPPVITTIVLPNGKVGQAYLAALTATGGTAPLSWAASNLPDGLNLAVDGVISGQPTRAGTAQVLITATDSAVPPVSTSTTLSLTIEPPPVSIATTVLPNAKVGVVYSATIVATGGSGGLTFSALGLPAGLTMSSAGVIAGTPLSPGVSQVSVTATDGNGGAATATLTLVVDAAPLLLSTTSLPNGQVGQTYNATVSASGGTGNLSFVATNLPLGLSMSSTGTISGIPTSAGTALVTITVTDTSGRQASATLSLLINPAPGSLCTKPVGAKSAKGKGRITALGAGYIVVGTIKVMYAECTRISLNGAVAMAVGQRAEWEGFAAAGSNTALKITIN